MPTIINRTPAPAPEVVVDFGWYEPGPTRGSEYTYTSNGATYPPGYTTLAGSVTTPLTPETVLPGNVISVTSTSNFDGGTSGVLVLNDGTAHAVVTYAGISGNTFVGCNSTSAAHTYASTTPCWDPRFYVDSAPLQTLITFDAQDSQNLGLKKTVIPPGIQVVRWIWDFGNGETGSGPIAGTTYPYNSAPPSTQVSLTIIDNLNRSVTTSHPLILLSGETLGGSGTRH